MEEGENTTCGLQKISLACQTVQELSSTLNTVSQVHKKYSYSPTIFYFIIAGTISS
jgi:hypothetical protein